MTSLKMNDLPPETQEKIKAALKKMASFPGLLSMLGGSDDLTKLTKDLTGIPLIPTDKSALIKKMMEGIKSDQTNTTETEIIEVSSDPAVNTPSTQTNQQYSPPTDTLSPKNYAKLNTQRNFTPTYNPHIQSDHLRRNIFVLAILTAISILIYQYVFKGHLPF